jgi:hypothetical protein
LNKVDKTEADVTFQQILTFGETLDVPFAKPPAALLPTGHEALLPIIFEER